MSTPLEQINEARTQAKEEIELADALDKLYKSRAFKKVFEEHIFKELPAKTASIYNRPGLPETAKQSMENTLTMISTLQHTFSTIMVQGNQAHSDLTDIAETEAEYLAESEE